MIQILFRKSLTSVEEYNAANQHFNVVESILDLEKNTGVIGRYSVLPYYDEIERDIEKKECYMIMPQWQHEYISSFLWYYDLEEFTPKTYFDLSLVPDNGPFVVKGKTNSKKFFWDEDMFAETKRDAIRIANKLMKDSLIQSQGIVVREYIPLKTFEIGVHGLPFTNEWRVFFYDGKLIDYGFYWSIMDDLSIVTKYKNSFIKNGLNLAQKVANILYSVGIKFVSIDIAETCKNEWVVIEVNDGQMSGLSTIVPDSFYKNFRKIIDAS